MKLKANSLGTSALSAMRKLHAVRSIIFAPTGAFGFIMRRCPQSC